MSDIEKAIIRQIFITQEPLFCSIYLQNETARFILNIPTSEIFEEIKINRQSLVPVTTYNIPQFSNPDDISNVLKVIKGLDDKFIPFKELGYFLCNKDANDGAREKYGENHYKLAMQLGLVTSSKPYDITSLGDAYLSLLLSEQIKLRAKLSLRIPIIQYALIQAEISPVNVTDLMGGFLSHSTVLRRRSNVRSLLNALYDESDEKLKSIIANICW